MIFVSYSYTYNIKRSEACDLKNSCVTRALFINSLIFLKNAILFSFTFCEDNFADFNILFIDKKHKTIKNVYERT